MSINWQEIIFSFLGGLGLFLYSIRMMGDGLQQAAGDRLRYFIDKYTSNPFLGVLALYRCGLPLFHKKSLC